MAFHYSGHVCWIPVNAVSTTLPRCAEDGCDLRAPVARRSGTRLQSGGPGVEPCFLRGTVVVVVVVGGGGGGGGGGGFLTSHHAPVSQKGL